MQCGMFVVAGFFIYLGGFCPPGVELHPPATGNWSPTFPLVSGRTDHIAPLLSNGTVLVAGGFNNADTGPSTELFDPSSVAPVPTVLTRPTSTPSGAIQFTFRNTPGLGFTILSTANPTLLVD